MIPNRSILQKRKANIFALLIIILVQTLSLLLLSSLFIAFSEQLTELSAVRVVVFASISFIYIWIDLFFFYTRVILLGILSHKIPLRCRIEDFLYIGYKKDGRTKYSPYPIVRSLKGNKLFFTYGSYSLAHFNTNSSYINNGVVNCTIYKKGGTPVKIGDAVDVYLLKILDIPVLIDAEKNELKLKNKNIEFYHINNKVHISVFNEITFFQGVVNLDER